MAHSIKILPDHIVNKIAAGEVVERPASVVKELLENSLDAGATEVFIDIEQAGKRLIRITDNGSGMSKEDAQTAFLRHATSKIRTEADLEAIRTMGFRGEALSSIASVSQIRMVTAEQDAASGVMVQIEDGTVKSMTDAAAPHGTSIEVSHLFYNTPARLKFLKSPATEFAHILSAVSHQAMAHPEIRFKLLHNKKMVLDLPPASNVQERAMQVYGRDLSEQLIEISAGRSDVVVSGLLARPTYTRADRTYQDFTVNHRPIKNPSLTHALYNAYGDMLMRDRHPVCFLFIEIDPQLVDVNVHPAKAEVRFRNQSQIHDLVRDLIRGRLRMFGIPESRSARPEDVREAISDYLRVSENDPETIQPKPKPLTYNFGRRKTDFVPQAALETMSSQVSAGDPSQVSFPAFGQEHSPGAAAENVITPLAQVHDSFIVAQSAEGMVLIDQHAAHERVLFEKLQDHLTSDEVAIQNLLMPVAVELGPAERSLIPEYLPELGRLGLVVEDFGGGTYVIKAVPFMLVGADYKKLFLDILDEITVRGRTRRIEELRHGILSVMACHPAIKVHRRLEKREMEKLIQDLFSCRMPHTCPHGRPTLVRFSLDEIKKMFKRI